MKSKKKIKRVEPEIFSEFGAETWGGRETGRGTDQEYVKEGEPEMSKSKSKSKHTPGPWKVVEQSCRRKSGYAFSYPAIERDSQQARAYKAGHGPSYIAVLPGFFDREQDAINTGKFYIKERNANAKLISAAPELLAICKDVVQYLTRNYGELNEKGNDLAIYKLLNVICKAEGI